MENTEKEKQPYDLEKHKVAIQRATALRIKTFGLAIIVSLASIAIFGGAGYLLDLKMGTKPLLLLVGIVISFPVTQLILAKLVKKLTKQPLYG